MDARWPSTAETALLRAALLDGEEARGAWRDWSASARVDDMDVPSLRLVPLLYRNLTANEIEDPRLARLKPIYLESWRRNQRLFQRGAEALSALGHAGVQTMVLKGAGLATLDYPDAGSRPMVDFDVLVRPDDSSRARAALEQAGWQGQPVAAVLHAAPLTGPDGQKLDLHWRALDQSARDDDFWEGARRTEIGGVETLAPGPAEQLLHVCAHGLGIAPASPRWVADAVTVARQPALDWDRLVERTLARRLTLFLLPALRYVRATFGIEVPDDALARLERAPVTAGERLLHRAAFGRHRQWRFAAQTWDRYRRLRGADQDSPASDGFLRFLADQLGFGSRRQMLAYVATAAMRTARGERGGRRPSGPPGSPGSGRGAGGGR